MADCWQYLDEDLVSCVQRPEACCEKTYKLCAPPPPYNRWTLEDVTGPEPPTCGGTLVPIPSPGFNPFGGDCFPVCPFVNPDVILELEEEETIREEDESSEDLSEQSRTEEIENASNTTERNSDNQPAPPLDAEQPSNVGLFKEHNRLAEDTQ